MVVILFKSGRRRRTIQSFSADNKKGLQRHVPIFKRYLILPSFLLQCHEKTETNLTNSPRNMPNELDSINQESSRNNISYGCAVGSCIKKIKCIVSARFLRGMETFWKKLFRTSRVLQSFSRDHILIEKWLDQNNLVLKPLTVVQWDESENCSSFRVPQNSCESVSLLMFNSQKKVKNQKWIKIRIWG